MKKFIDILEEIEQTSKAIAAAKQEELKAACDRFNALAVGDITRLYYDKHIYTNMDI